MVDVLLWCLTGFVFWYVTFRVFLHFIRTLKQIKASNARLYQAIQNREREEEIRPMPKAEWELLMQGEGSLWADTQKIIDRIDRELRAEVKSRRLEVKPLKPGVQPMPLKTEVKSCGCLVLDGARCMHDADTRTVQDQLAYLQYMARMFEENR